MSDALEDMVEGSQKCLAGSLPYLYAGDRPRDDKTYQKYFVEYPSLQACVRDEGLGPSKNKLMHVSLIPQPYFGRLQTATIVMLMANPGLGPHDYFAEESDPDFKQALVNNLVQQDFDEGFPFLSLNPKFASYFGFTYWTWKFRRVIERLVQRGLSPREALSFLACNLAVVQLVPYHSVEFGAGTLVEGGQLRSALAVKKFADELLTERNARGEVLVLNARQTRLWGCFQENTDTVICYGLGETRGANISKEQTTRILKWLDSKGLLPNRGSNMPA